MRPLSYVNYNLPLNKEAQWRTTKQANAVTNWLGNAVAPGLAGLGTGAFSGFVSGVMDARAQGADWSDSFRQGAGQAARMGLVGGLGGGILGASFPRFGQRMVDFGKGTLHAVTGWVPKNNKGKADLSLLNAGSSQSKRLLEAARAKGISSKDIQLYEKEIAALQAAEEKGLTNLPGLFKGIIDPRRTLDTIQTSGRVLWDGTPLFGKILLGAGTIGSVIPVFVDRGENDPRTLGQRIFQGARGLGSFVLGSPLNIMTSQAASNPATLRQMAENMWHSNLSQGVGRLMDAPANEIDRAWTIHNMKKQNNNNPSHEEAKKYYAYQDGYGRLRWENPNEGTSSAPPEIPVADAYNTGPYVNTRRFPTAPTVYHVSRVSSFGPVPEPGSFEDVVKL